MSQSLYALENVMREAQKTLNSVNEALPPGDPSYPLFTIAELAPPAQLTLDACVYRRGQQQVKAAKKTFYRGLFRKWYRQWTMSWPPHGHHGHP